MSDLGNLYGVYNDMHKLVYFTVKSREKLWGFLFCTVAIFYDWQGQSTLSCKGPVLLPVVISANRIGPLYGFS